MANQLKLLVGSSALAVLLTACGGGGSSSSAPADSGPTARALPPEIADIIDDQNELTDALCPGTSGDAEEGGSINPEACFGESEEGAEEDTGHELSLNPVVQQFCPEAAQAFDATFTFQGEMLDQDFVYDTDTSFDGSATFPAACLQEAAANFQNIGDMIGGSNPLTEALCPEESADGEVDPANCFAEAVGQGGLPGGGGGEMPGADQLLAQICPETGEQELGPQTPINCLNEASRVYMDIYNLLTESNGFTEQVCPQDSADGRIDPPQCFAEALLGFGGIPGGGGGGGDGGNPLAPVMEQFCPETAMADLGPSTPIDCLAEAGGNFQDVQDLLLGSNPLTDNLCPEAAANPPIDPAACFTEAAAGFPGGLPGGDGNPFAPVMGQFCPETAEEPLGPTTAIDCLTEAGGSFGDVQDLLTGSNPLTEAFCPEESADGTVDPAACFMEAVSSGGLPGGDGNPFAPVMGQFCPDTAEAPLGPTTPIDCLTEAGGSFDDIQDLLTGSNPLTEAFCPEESADGTVDPAACFMEALQSGGGLPGGDGNPFAPVMGQFCPDTAEQPLGPTTPVDCLTEAGGNFGDIQDLLTGSNPLTEAFCPEESADGTVDPAACFMEAAGGGGLPGGDGNPFAPVMGQFCPDTAEQPLGPTTPIDCLTEAGGNFGDVQDLLTGSNPLTEAFCPEESADGTVDPAACFMEAVSSGGLPGGDGNPFAPIMGQFCPDTAEQPLGPTTPFDCLNEAGSSFGDIEELLTGSNPLTEAFCPEESADGTVDPAACFMEALASGGGLPGGDGNPFAPVMSQFCPNTAEQPLGPTTPIDCLTEAGGDFGDLEDLLGPLMESNPLTEQLCPEESADGTVDPAGCFIEGLNFVELLDSSSLGLFPDCPLLSGGNDSGNLSLTLGLGCLLQQSDNPSLGLDSLDPSTLAALFPGTDLSGNGLSELTVLTAVLDELLGGGQLDNAGLEEILTTDQLLALADQDNPLSDILDPILGPILDLLGLGDLL